MTVTQTIWTPTSDTPTRILMRPEPRQRPAASALPASETLMTIKDVADACKLSETAVRRAVFDGELPAVKLRSRLRITRADFDGWIASQRQSPPRATAPPRSAPRARRPAPAGSFRALVHADAARAQAR
jgi:excisionase family DNA binding protein